MTRQRIRQAIKKHIVPILLIIALGYTLPVYDKYWAPWDEGIIVVAGQRLLAGQIPYKDFFILMYPPAQIYIVAVLLKAFTAPLIAARIYTVLISVASAMLVFYMTRRLTKSVFFAFLSWFVALTSLAPRLGAIPAPIWPGVFLGLLAIYFYMLYLEKGRDSLLIWTGALTGASILFRHDIGIFAGAAVLLPILVQTVCQRSSFYAVRTFTAGVVIAVLPCLVYFINKSAIKDMFDSLVLFSLIHERTAGIPFPKPCFDPNMIFHKSLYFITANQYYIPVITYIAVILYFVKEIFKRVFYKKENLALLSLLTFGVLAFNQVRIRTDPAHLLSVIEPTLVLAGFILCKIFSFRSLRSALPQLAVGGVLLLLLGLLSVKNMDKYMKNAFTKVYKRKIVKARFNGDSIYVPAEEREDVLNAIGFIKKNTKPGDKIYVGNIVHWKDDFGGSIILYFLADRLPSTKYYQLQPGLVTDPDVQKEIKDSLLINEVGLLVLQDIELGGFSKRDAPKDKLILDDFIEHNYKSAKKFGKYNIYMKR